MDGWKFDVTPEPYELRFREAKYAIVMVMGGDGDLGGQLHPDLFEMTKAVGEDVAALVLVDYPQPGEDEERPKSSRVLEILPSVTKPVEFLAEINTGDPRPLADFLARALVSFSEETRIAIGFWGHGNGVFQDYDPEEIVLSREIRFGPLGAEVTEAIAEERVAVEKQVLARSMLPDATSENALTNREASSALAAAFCRARRTEPVDLLFFDTCLNGSVEVFAELRRFAKTFVASSLLVPGDGWNYELWMKATRQEQPASAEDWAFLAAGVFGATYDQRVCKKPAQLGAFSSLREPDFVECFAEIVGRLRGQGRDGVELAKKAAVAADKVIFGENVDLGHFVLKLRELTDDEGLRGAVDRFEAVYVDTVLGLSIAPPKGENLTGMTIWFPLQGDLQGVSRYYELLEFERRTGWLDFLRTREEPRVEESEFFSMYGFWGLELVEARPVEHMAFSRDPEVRRFLLKIPEMAREFAGGLVEGDYAFHGGSGTISFRSYVVLREFVRKVMEIREGDAFEALRECYKAGWVIGGSACVKLFSEFERYQGAFFEACDDELDRALYAQLMSVFRKAGDDGVLVFYPLI